MPDDTVLPASWYVDPRVLKAEQNSVFAAAPDYVGCVSRVTADGGFLTVAQRRHTHALVRSNGQLRLMDNICAHRGHEILRGQGVARALVCPMHRWTYDLQGQLIGAPLYKEKPCVSLASRPVYNWNGILFAGNRNVEADLASLSQRPELDVSHYRFVDCDEEEQPVNWKIPVEVYLENYHAPFIHPGLSRFVAQGSWYANDGAFDSPHLMWQEMKPHPDFHHNPDSVAFEQWQQAIIKTNDGKFPDFAALICLYSPNVFMEWFPFTFVVTTYIPNSAEITLMIREFYYDPKALERVPEFPALTRAAYHENQWQDDKAHESLHRGRAVLATRNPANTIGHATYHPTMEDSVRIFHSGLVNSVAPYLRRD
ncbi:aromatic ring-hydroxylating dioxygenase subunit alpha [Nitrospirillum sp. BR 11828]|uniref:aromatic ring-hydroxylating oxygenase subunit alpha n=1 Tax=Nitrospirillum sp. BR 11828 TaxID=3104325 RepID=UPI002ACA2605|nr:aromatic ring-hydroxylating dioxygenase subunit alpha [Nitrospirillum sp. BR 11828]MDZ5649364.1 aromatic ring-hydroxylating dioxygenase subunit alpha [Nitrospirillum sp. BR 11828]